MIYPNLRVPIPDAEGYVFQQNSVRYQFVYVGGCLSGTDGKTRHPKAMCIGRLEPGTNGSEELMPNSNYYKLMGLPQPEGQVSVDSGEKVRKPAELHEDSSAAALELTSGYGLCVMHLSNELGLTEALDRSFGEIRRMQILRLAAFLCLKRQYSLISLQSFSDEVSGVFGKEKCDRQMVGELLVDLSNPVASESFYVHWNKLRPLSNGTVFYDLTSFSVLSGRAAEAYYRYNRDDGDLPQINHGLFCEMETGLPLYMCSYDGSLNDCVNLDVALTHARDHGVAAGERVVLVTDAGYAKQHLNWNHLANFDLIAGVSAVRVNSVKAAFLAWAKLPLKLDEVWMCDGRCFISEHKPIEICGLKGDLMMCRDIDAMVAKAKHLTVRKEKIRDYLAGLERAPEGDFAEWSKSFVPFCVVEKSDEPKGFRFREGTKGLDEAYALCGKVTLFTHFSGKEAMSDQDIMGLYISKSDIEDCFDTTNNGLSDERLNENGERTLSGKLLVLFIALVLRRTFSYRLREWLKAEDYTYEEALDELTGIPMYKDTDQWHFKNEPSVIQQEIMHHLRLNPN